MTEDDTLSSVSPQPAPQPEQLQLQKAAIDWRSLQTQMVAGIIAMVVVVFALYGSGLSSSFGGSDLRPLNITLKALSGDSQAFVSELNGTVLNGSFGFRPVFYLTLLAESVLFHGAPAGYLFVNVLFLLGSCVLLSFVVLEITGKFGNRLGACPAIWAGLLYAAYPWNSFTLTHLNGLQPLMGSFFALLSLFCFLRFNLINERKYFVISVIAFALSALSWDSAVLFPAVLTLSFLLPVSSLRSVRAKVELLAPFWTLAFLYVIALPDWVYQMSETLKNARFSELGSLGNRVCQMIVYTPDDLVGSSGTVMFIAVLAVMVARLIIAQESYRAALFVFLWALLYLAQPTATWSAAFIAPLCAMVVIIVLPAIDRMGKGMSALYATAGSQLLICLICYWAYRMINFHD